MFRCILGFFVLKYLEEWLCMGVFFYSCVFIGVIRIRRFIVVSVRGWVVGIAGENGTRVIVSTDGRFFFRRGKVWVLVLEFLEFRKGKVVRVKGKMKVRLVGVI